MNHKDFFALLKTAFRFWQVDNVNLRAAALTFFIILPLPSLLLIVIAIFSQFYGQGQAFQQLIEQISLVAGPAVAALFSQLLESASTPFTSVWASIIVVVFSLVAATGAFSVLRETMDVIWKVNPPKQTTLIKSIRQKIGPFVLISTLGLIVITWAGFAAVLFNLIHLTSLGIKLLEILLSFALSTLLFSVIYKQIPEANVQWHDVLLASLVTGLAFTIVNYLIGTYVQTFPITTIVGAAGSLMVLLLWIFILNQIVLFGAEISRAYAVMYGSYSKKHMLKIPVAEKKSEDLANS